MAITKDPIGDFLDFDDAPSTPPEKSMGYRSGAFEMTDASGTFNPRIGSGQVGVIVFTIGCGLVYTTAGDVVLKEAF